MILFLCRTRPRKVTNSEKTCTTSNLSQHKYLRNRHQLQQNDERGLLNGRNKGIASPGIFCGQYLEPEWENEKFMLDVDSASYKQQRSQLMSYHTFAKLAASHGYRSNADLSKLLISAQLAPQVSAKEQSAALCNLQTLHSSATSHGSDEEPLSRLVDIVTREEDSCDYQASSLNCQSVIVSDAHKFPLINTTDKKFPRRSLRVFGEQITTSAPECSNRSLSVVMPRSRSKHPLDKKIVFLSSENAKTSRVKKRHISSLPCVTRSSRCEERTKEYHSQLTLPNPMPCSHWYEMKTPKFHIEAKRHNKFVRKVCNW